MASISGSKMNSHDQVKKQLYNSAVKGEWPQVTEIYRQHQWVHNAMITRTHDTALHVAVSGGQEDVVVQLVNLISTKNDDAAKKKALNMKNERGNTPLHLAAAQGNVKMCKCMAEIDETLIGVRNEDNETPFFLAALNGKKDAFLCLHYHISSDNERTKEEKGYIYSRRNSDGQTILHVAIDGEYFDLAFQIMCKYGKLVNYINLPGYSPLHLLAKQSSSFKSQSHLGWFQKIIYQCTFVDELKVTETYSQPSYIVKTFEEELYPKHPQNYQTCRNLYRLFENAFRLLTGLKKKANEPNKQHQQADPEKQGKKQQQDQDHQMFPLNYQTCYELIKFFSKAILIILGVGNREIRKIQHKKEKHTWSVQIMKEFLKSSKDYEYLADGQKPQDVQVDEEMLKNMQEHYEIVKDGERITNVAEKATKLKGDEEKKKPDSKNETPILLAAKNGIKEMVDEILSAFPLAIDDMNSEKKNIVLLAVENRQPHIYNLLLEGKWKVDKENMFRKVDEEGNSALHLAAKLGNYRPWLISGAALQMQWEYKWYQFVKNSMPLHFFRHHNKKGQTPHYIFTDTHKELVESGANWLTNTSQSCSVVAALIATVAFATASTVPGGVKEDSGKPNLENKPLFDVFGIAALVALCFSVTALVMFLAILTSRYQEKDFLKVLPRRLLFGLSSLFMSISAILVSFSAGHFFVLKDSLKSMALPVYVVTCVPVTFFAVAQFPLYFDLIRATFGGVPQRSYNVLAP